MADSLSLTATKKDGTVVTIVGALSGATITETAPVVVQPPPPPPPPVNPEPTIPANAAVIDMLPAVVPWAENFDPGTQNAAKTANATGTTSYPVTAPDGTTVRQFQFTLTNKGGEIFHANVLKDSSLYNEFCYETVESSDDWSNIACAEKDLEQADATGAYVDMATQLSAYSGTVEVTGGHKWQATKVGADPSKRAPKVLHTTRIYVRDNGDGTWTIRGIFLDGTYTPIGITLSNLGSVKWGKNVLNLQLQYDGKSSASVQSTVYMHVLRLHAWKS
jgi:hypothetical protein